MNIHSSELRKKILIYLFGLAVLLLALNLVFNNKIVFSSDDEKAINSDELGNRFNNILTSFGIEEKLIKKTVSADKVTGLRIPLFRVQVPKDLSIPEILLDIFNEFRKDSLEIESIEKVKSGKSLLTIKKGRTSVLSAEFDYSKNISREKRYLALLITDINYNSQGDSVLIESSQSVNFLIRPDSKYKGLINYIKSYKKEYSILIDDGTGEQKYKLAAGYSAQRVINVLKTLVKDFSKASYFVIDDKTELYNSANYKIISEALSKRQIKLFRLSDFLSLDESENWLDDFGKRMDQVSSNESSIFLISKNSYKQIEQVLSTYYKKGYRIVNSSLLISDSK